MRLPLYLTPLRSLYNLDLEKKKKMRSGTISFKEKKLYYGDFVIFHWFEVEYSSQATSNSGSDKIVSTIKLLDFS